MPCREYPDEALAQEFAVTEIAYADYRDEWPRMIEDMKRWMAEGLITSKVDIVDGGVEMFPEVLPRLFKGENFGKLMIRIPISDHKQLGGNRG